MTGVLPQSYLEQSRAMPFCKGCGHAHVVRRLDEALATLRLDPADICLVSDIGCIGLVDALFRYPHTVHTTHGRSTAFATGIELADSVLAPSRLKTVVLIGDGGATIGLLHLVTAALLNVDVTVLLCNNFLFGMTGGQNSAFSPIDFVTPTTPSGNIIPPLDMCRMMIDAHAAFVARKLATDRDLVETIADAVAHPGFAMVEIVELCTEYGTKRNAINGASLRKTIEKQGHQLGLLRRSTDRSEFSVAYKEKFPPQDAAERKSNTISPTCTHSLDSELGIVLAGTAGERVQSSAAIFCEAAVHAGLHCTLKTDNPVTQGSGFSFAEIKLSPFEIDYTGIPQPDVIIAVSRDGWQELVGRGVVASSVPSTLVLLDDGLDVPAMRGRVHRLPFRSRCKSDSTAAAALMVFLQSRSIFPPELYLNLLRKKLSDGVELLPTTSLWQEKEIHRPQTDSQN